ncbi:HipA family kinase [uncultured Roseobacter sp.]|uniref:HipA family kinase n=1 Tax=uncultured Roseobacter sp. TaxID=114847 RepID=UPI003454B573
MIEYATAAEFIRPTEVGRTGPAIISCQSNSNDQLELFCKFSDGCDEGVVNLAREVVAACLAADLNLPVPKPYLVEVSEEFISLVPDDQTRGRMERSSRLCFGSSKAPNQFSTWPSEGRVTETMRPIAAAVLLFDGIVQNVDRRESNPNCLSRGNELRIIDHELCFATRLLLGWTPPWLTGGFDSLRKPGNHMFFKGLFGSQIDYTPIKVAWKDLSNERIDEYEAAIPTDWSAAKSDVESAVDLIRKARDHIDDCVAEMRRVLS